MRLGLAADHAGFRLKDALAAHLAGAGHEIVDLGVNAPDSVDYPDFARPLAERVARRELAFGVLCCGTGSGMAIAANKVAGVRAVPCTTELVARMARAHNDANVLCLGERIVGVGWALAILDAFLATPFEGGRHQRRVDGIRRIESAG